ncbi:HAD hydrolase-like protein [Megalodesulfovibrio paquesii]
MPLAVLSDVEGTLTHRGQALPGAAEALAEIKRRGLGLRLITNITARTPERIAADLAGMGLQVEPGEILTATMACLAHMRTLRTARPPRTPQAGLRCALLVPEAVRPLFADIEDCIVAGPGQAHAGHNTQASPDVDLIIMGDLGEGFSYALLNQVLRWMQGGAELLALQKNPFWFAADGPRLDCGAYVAALEAATGVQAQVAGKPSPLFFGQAVASLGCRAEEVLVIGDDLLTDVAGAVAIGARCAMVGTGKWKPGQEAQLRPGDYFLPSLFDLPALLDSLPV